MKKCKYCSETKPLDSFHRAAAFPDGHAYKCKQCYIQYRADNRPKILEKERLYRINFADKIKKYKADNTEIINANTRKRRAIKKMATPAWISEDLKRQMGALYREAKRLSSADGNRYHVDHIVPLISKEVCGLHVLWNLQILSSFDNGAKGNRI